MCQDIGRTLHHTYFIPRLVSPHPPKHQAPPHALLEHPNPDLQPLFLSGSFLQLGLVFLTNMTKTCERRPLLARCLEKNGFARSNCHGWFLQLSGQSMMSPSYPQALIAFQNRLLFLAPTLLLLFQQSRSFLPSASTENKISEGS